jgi:energy-coupling factor transporter ATP-binding protein EcfA2
MTLPQATWKQVYAAFDPTARVEFDDADLFVGRPGTVAQSIVDDLRLGLDPRGKWVVCGAMGSGKSSELVHLARLLWESHAVIGLDLPRSVARVDRLAPAEVLYLIGLAAVRAARDLWSCDIGAKAVAELHASFSPLLSETAREINPAEIVQGVALLTAHAIGGPGAAGLAAGAARAVAAALPNKLKISRGTSLGGSARPTKDGDPDLDRLQAAVDAVLSEVAAYRPPVVLVDGLDKIQELRPIRDLFSGSQILSLPQAPVIYTGPITLMLATEWQQVAGRFRRERLTNVVVSRPDLPHIDIAASKISDGVRALEAVVEHRLRRLSLTPSDIFAEGSLTQVIEASGGLLRDLIHLVNRAVRWCLRHDAAAITDEAVSEAMTELRREYEITLNGKRVEELVYVARKGEPSGNGDVSAELLLGGYVLPYANGRVWFAPHAILKGLREGL